MEEVLAWCIDMNGVQNKNVTPNAHTLLVYQVMWHRQYIYPNGIKERVDSTFWGCHHGTIIWWVSQDKWIFVGPELFVWVNTILECTNTITIFVNLGFFQHFETITNIRTWIKSHRYWRMLLDAKTLKRVFISRIQLRNHIKMVQVGRPKH